MPGSALSISGPNIVLNTIVAETLSQFADELEGSSDFTADLNTLIKKAIKEHKRIIFNGNGYDSSWVEEAEKRGLLNLKSTPDALPYFITQKNIDLFTKHKIFTAAEMHSRYEILLDNYCKALNIEALTMIDMAKKQILPAVFSYLKDLSGTATQKKAISADIPCEPEESLIRKISSLAACFYKKTEALESALLDAKNFEGDLQKEADHYKGDVFTAMQEMRLSADELETLLGKSYWPFPSYSDLLFRV